MSLPINMYGWCSKTTAALTTSDNVLQMTPEDTAAMCLALGNATVGMTLRSLNRSEFVTVACTNGVLVMERGVDGSEPLAHPTGAVMRFDWTPTNMALAIACADTKPSICEVVSKSLDITYEENDEGVECVARIELAGTAVDGDDDEEMVSWKACGKKYTAPSRIVTATNDPDASPPGIFDPAKVVVDSNGCAKFMEGTATTHIGCGCGCKSCSEDEETE